MSWHIDTNIQSTLMTKRAGSKMVCGLGVQECRGQFCLHIHGLPFGRYIRKSGCFWRGDTGGLFTEYPFVQLEGTAVCMQKKTILMLASAELPGKSDEPLGLVNRWIR